MSLVSTGVEEQTEELFDLEEAVYDSRYKLGCFLLAGMISYGLFGQIAAVLTSAGLHVPSRLITIPSRALLLGLAMASLGALALRPGRFTLSWGLLAFFGFWAAYASRILIVAATRVDVVIETGRFTLGFIATMAAGGVFLPALAILVNSCWEMPKLLRNLTVALAMGSGLMTIIFYGKTFTNFEHRMSAGDTSGEVVTINSLAIGYLGAGLVVASAYFFVCLSRKGLWGTLVGIVAGGMGLFLMVGSASRGPLVCSGATGAFLLLTQLRNFSIRKLFMVISSVVISAAGIVLLTQATGSTVLDRLLGIGYAIQTNSEGASRLEIWQMAISEISYSPLWGSSLTLRAEDGTDMYPHNLFLESMLATGLVGTIPLLFVLFFAFRSAWMIILEKPEFGWVALYFVLYFNYQMLGGAIYASGQFWISTAAVISCGEWVRRKLAEEEEEETV